MILYVPMLKICTMKCWLSKVGVIALRNVVGKEVVETMSPEFVDFIQEAYQRLRWGEKQWQYAGRLVGLLFDLLKIHQESIRFRADKKSSSEMNQNCSECDSFQLYHIGKVEDLRNIIMGVSEDEK